MKNKDASELLNMYKTAAQLAKAKDKRDFHFKVSEAELIELLKKAFPAIQSDEKLKKIAKNILNT